MKDESYNIGCKCECMGSAATEKGCITSLAINGSLLYAGSESASIFIFEKTVDAFVQVAEMECGAPVKALLSVESSLFAGLHDNKLKLWSHDDHTDRRLKLVKTLPTLKDRIQNSIKPGSFVQIRRHHKRLWIKHADAISCLAFCLEDGLLYSGSWDKTVKVWRLSDFKCLESIRAHDDAVNAIACARINGGLIIFTGSGDGTVRVWSRKRHYKHDHVTTLVQSQSDAVNCLVLNPDMSILYSGTSGGQINYWTILDDQSVQICNKATLSAHKRSVMCLTTLKQFVCSGSADGTIRVYWRRGRGVSTVHRCVAVVDEGHRGPVKCITSAASPSLSSTSSSTTFYHHSDYTLKSNGFVVYSGSMDGTVKMWRVSHNECKLCERGRTF